MLAQRLQGGPAPSVDNSQQLCLSQPASTQAPRQILKRQSDTEAASPTTGKISDRLMRGKTNERQDERAARSTGSMCNEQQRNGGVTNGGVTHRQRDERQPRSTGGKTNEGETNRQQDQRAARPAGGKTKGQQD
ncbi:hypothetical protein AeMF1_019641 [Aphanomyces euteiches]|nr:hypothetical protein AeMF1_019641 [Aphanomyces euteiches]KAH9181390.1 hypothetical protein AeNC1_016634 [Aphanomyces euteiches]